MEKVVLQGTPAPAGPYYGDKAGRCKKVLSWPISGDKGTRCRWDLARGWVRKGWWKQLFLGPLVTGSCVSLYHTQPMGSTFRRNIGLLHGHPRAAWPTLWSPLRKPQLPAPGDDIPAPSPSQCPTCPAATPSNLYPCPGRLAQPHLSHNDYHYTTKTSRGSHLPTLRHMKLHTMGQEKAQEPTLCLRLPTVMYKIIIRLLSHNVETWCASVPLLSSGANAAAF